MKKVLPILLAVIFIVGALGAAGTAGYRYGYSQGLVATTDNANGLPGFGYGPQNMPMHPFGFDREFRHGRGMDRGFGMMPGGMSGFGFFRPLMLLARVAFWGLVIWAIYMLVTRSGWRLTRATQSVETPPTTTETEAKE